MSSPSPALSGAASVLVVDDEAAVRVGFETSSSSITPYVNIGYRHDSDDYKGEQHATFTFKIRRAGRYKVRLAWSAFSNRATNVPLTVTQQNRQKEFTVNQRIKPQTPPFGTAGVVDLQAGTATVRISNTKTDGHVILDAVQLLLNE